MADRIIIFDLDGTLIDSAPSILNSLQATLDEASITPIRPLNKDIIGPPLHQIISKILGNENIDRIPEIIEGFKKKYDQYGYLGTLIYPGIQEMLDQLKRRNIDLYIATNKRIAPTNSILSHLGWGDFFREIYTLDYFSPPAPDKSTMLSRLIEDCKILTSNLIYVGDRYEDYKAAGNNKIPFFLASWGYANNNINYSFSSKLDLPSDVLRLI